MMNAYQIIACYADAQAIARRTRRLQKRRSTTGNSNIDVLGVNLAIWAARRCRNHLNIFIELVVVENPEFAVGISTLSVTVP